MTTGPVARRLPGRLNWYGLFSLYLKEVKRFLKIPAQTVVAPLTTALLMMAVFTLALGGGARQVHGVPFLHFLGPGLVMMAIIQSAFANPSSTLVMAKIQGNIVDLLMAPLGAFEVAAGLVLSGLTRGVVTGTALVVAMAPFVALIPAHPWAVAFHAVMGAAMMAALGLIAGLWADKFDHMSAATNFVITPLAFLSGTFYSITRLPESLQALSRANPVFYLIDGLRYGFIGVADGSVAIGVAVVAAVTAALWAAGLALLASGYKIRP